MKIITGDCISEMRKLDDNSIDAIITDPPYGIGFMGKEWDTFTPDIITKGVHNSARKNISAIYPERGCGFDGSPAWESARYNRTLSGNLEFQRWFTEVSKECFRLLKPGAHFLSCCGTRTQHRMAAAIEDAGFEIRDLVAWVYGSGFPKSQNISLFIDKQAGVIGDRSRAFRTAGAGEREDIQNRNGVNDMAYNDPKTVEGKQWRGWGTALKPAMELWTLARKPLQEKTIAKNILKYGTGGINIDESRLMVDENENLDRSMSKPRKTDNYIYDKANSRINPPSPLGRWPANFIHDGSEEVRECFPNTNGDRLSVSRFFYCSKSSKSERNNGLESFEEKESHKMDGGKFNSASTIATERKMKNFHPTVKPLSLMRYLCKLITPPNGIILDPFLGSGTTGVAAKIENFDFIGIDKVQEYVEIANGRINAINKSHDSKTINS